MLLNSTLSDSEEYAGNLVANAELVDTEKQLEMKCVKHGKLVSIHFTFIAKTNITSGVGYEIFTGIPTPYMSTQFTGHNYTTNTPVTFAVYRNAVYQWHAGIIQAGDTVRLGMTYICV